MSTQRINLDLNRLPPEATLGRGLRFLDELVLARAGTSVIVDGSESLHVFEQVVEGNLFSRLLPLLDGSRSLAQIEAELIDVPGRAVRNAVKSLRSWGLVEEISRHASKTLVDNTETLDFFRRIACVTGMQPSGQQALELLTNSEVLIACCQDNSEWVEQLGSTLRSTGVGAVRILNQRSGEWNFLAEPGRRQVTLALSLGPDDAVWFERLAQSCRAMGIPWLRAAIIDAKGTAELGPLFGLHETCCYGCFHHLHGAPAEEVAGAWKLSIADLLFFSGLVSSELTYVMSQVAQPLTERGFRRYNLRACSATELRCSKLPGCPHCRPSVRQHPAAAGEEIRTSTALVYEDYMALQFPPAISERNGSTAHSVVSQPVKEFQHCRRVNLNRRVSRLDRSVLEILASPCLAATESLSVDHLGTVLLMGAGIRDPRLGSPQVKRWAATAGNLGSVELFALVNRVEGLAPGLYFYQANDHSLALFEPHDHGLDSTALARRVLGYDAEELPDAMIIFTGAYHRLARKYGAFGYRLTQFDAGVAAAQIHLVSRTLGIISRTVQRWPDDLLEEQLNLDTFDEQVTAVLELVGNHGRPAANSSGIANLQLQPGEPAALRSVRDFSGISINGICELLFKDSRVSEAALRQLPFATVQSCLPINNSTKRSLLPPPLRGGRLTGNVLAGRRTVRNYSNDPVTLDQLGTMLNCQHREDAADWVGEHQAGNKLELFVLAQRVDGLNPGVYHFNAETNSLEFVGEHPPLNQWEELFLQRDFASAAAAVWIAGNLFASCERHGPWGHRQLLLRAGAAGQRLWMAALALGLSGAVTAGVVPGVAKKFLPLDGYERCSLLVFVCGHAAKDFRVSGPKALTPKTEESFF